MAPLWPIWHASKMLRSSCGAWPAPRLSLIGRRLPPPSTRPPCPAVCTIWDTSSWGDWAGPPWPRAFALLRLAGHPPPPASLQRDMRALGAAAALLRHPAAAEQTVLAARRDSGSSAGSTSSPGSSRLSAGEACEEWIITLGVHAFQSRRLARWFQLLGKMTLFLKVLLRDARADGMYPPRAAVHHC